MTWEDILKSNAELLNYLEDYAEKEGYVKSGDGSDILMWVRPKYAVYPDKIIFWKRATSNAQSEKILNFLKKNKVESVVSIGEGVVGEIEERVVNNVSVFARYTPKLKTVQFVDGFYDGHLRVQDKKLEFQFRRSKKE
jgi:hypothetical protein